MVRVLTQFKQRHIDSGVQHKLGSWLNDQRYQDRLGNLDAKKAERSESLGSSGVANDRTT